MKRRALGCCVVLIGLVLAACTVHTELPPNPDQLMKEGGRLYIEYCAECHQTDGSGWSNLYPRLAGNPMVTLHEPQPIIETVTYGQGSMPAFSEKITSDEIAAILTYIRNSWGNKADPVSPHQVH